MKHFLTILSVLLLAVSCKKGNDEPADLSVQRTVVVYMAAENDLSNQVQDDLRQMLEGSKLINDSYRLIVYIDQADKTKKPYTVRLRNGVATDTVYAAFDVLTSDPATLRAVMQDAMDRYPAGDYGLVLWGHANGWVIEKDSVASNMMARRHAFGRDTGDNSTSNTRGIWMNIPSMAKALSTLPKLTFIFADCCNFQCAEVAYELRNVCDYLIASPAEIPGEGAPYQTVVPAMFEKETFWKSIADRYFDQVIGDYYEPIAVVRTSEMERLAQATREVLLSCRDSLDDYPDMTGLIHYFHRDYYSFYDANDFVRQYAGSEDYAAWKAVLDEAVIYKKMATKWMTNRSWGYYYSDFEVTEEKFGGISMFVPQWRYQNTYNTDIQQMGWYKAAGYDELGW